MSTDRTRRLSPSELALKLACREAVKAAGGQDFVAGECSRTQSRISDWCSPNTAEFMPIDVIQRIEALGAGAPGHPHVTRALARAQGGSFMPVPSGQVVLATPLLGQLLADVAGESSDVIGLMAGMQLDAPIAGLSATDRAALRDECGDLIDLLSDVVAKLAPDSS